MTTIEHLKGSFSEPVTFRHRLLALKRVEFIQWFMFLFSPLVVATLFGGILSGLDSPNIFVGVLIGGLLGFSIGGFQMVDFLRQNVEVGPDVFLFGYHKQGATCAPAFFPEGGLGNAFLLSIVKKVRAAVHWPFELTMNQSTKVGGVVLIEFAFQEGWDPVSMERLLVRSYEDVSIVVHKELRLALKGLDLHALLYLSPEELTARVRPGVANAPEFRDTSLQIKVSILVFSVMHRTDGVATGSSATEALGGDNESMTSAVGS